MGFVRAVIIPRIEAILGSLAIPFCTIATNGIGTEIISRPPSISRVRTGEPFSTLISDTAETEGIPRNSAIIPPVIDPL